MDDHNEVIALPDSQKITFKEIAKSLLSKDKANRLKERAYALMGSVFSTEEQKLKDKNDDRYTRTALQRTTIDKYLAFLSGKPSECSTLSRYVILQFWLKEKDINGPTRLNVTLNNQIWKAIAGINANMLKNPDYYKALFLYKDSGCEEFLSIIAMDVKRTPGTSDSEELSKRLTNVLVNYSK